ncbi:hypothetical protein GCM10011348_41420 [Marinobacterium nitratireducens]|uniref:HTH tetR-type domain-containing protein n=1 Tax=Marinobacterium nitratireducens TaxID=518897 RepID=A0A917ZQ82_9GAMM|nr:TetR/AcrR family transcriptional regulator [Marinobacterium nitratireducens]GGO87675.1 hypothetical protein GCM10011348_41420 [Marinobacterium nitratireducens]
MHKPGSDNINALRRAGACSQLTIASGRGRPIGDHETKRARLLSAAITVLAQEGHVGASLRKVAKRAGCTTGTVTYYFRNKEAMITAIAKRLFEEIEKPLEAGLEPVDIRAIINRCLNWTSSNDSVSWLVPFQLLDYARHEPVFAAYVRERYGRIRELFTSILTRAQAQGRVRNDIPAELLAEQLGAISDGWMMMFPIEPERFQPTRIRALLDAAMALIEPPSSNKPETGASGE